jgi:hypothetical protein
MKHIRTRKEFLKEDIEFTNGEVPEGARRIPLGDLFGRPVDKPYVGLVIKLRTDLWGVIIDVFERNGDYLFDIYIKGDEEVNKNLSWSRDCKTVFGDLKYGWSAFGENGVPNKRHKEEIEPLIHRVMDKFGFDPLTKDDVEV